MPRNGRPTLSQSGSSHGQIYPATSPPATPTRHLGVHPLRPSVEEDALSITRSGTNRSCSILHSVAIGRVLSGVRIRCVPGRRVHVRIT